MGTHDSSVNSETPSRPCLKSRDNFVKEKGPGDGSGHRDSEGWTIILYRNSQLLLAGALTQRCHSVHL